MAGDKNYQKVETFHAQREMTEDSSYNLLKTITGRRKRRLLDNEQTEAKPSHEMLVDLEGIQ